MAQVILSIFFFGKDPHLMPLRGSFCCFSLAIVAVDINVENVKRNGTLLSQFAKIFVEARFLRNKTGWESLLGIWI